MKRIAAAAAAAGFALVLSASPSFAVEYTGGELNRYNACMSIDPGANAVATYDPKGGGPFDDECVVVSTATTLEESVERVNNERAAKAVTRTTVTEKTVTTTQQYRWAAGGAGGGSWGAYLDPISEEEAAFIEECMTTPGKDHCS